MSAVNNVESKGLSSRWRAFYVVILATLQVLVIWRLVEELSAARWTFAWLAVTLTGVLATGLHGLATRVNPTQKILWWVFILLVSMLGVDIFKLLHHSLKRDPFLTIFTEVFWIGLCILWIRRHPFELQT